MGSTDDSAINFRMEKGPAGNWVSVIEVPVGAADLPIRRLEPDEAPAILRGGPFDGKKVDVRPGTAWVEWRERRRKEEPPPPPELRGLRLAIPPLVDWTATEPSPEGFRVAEYRFDYTIQYPFLDPGISYKFARETDA